MTLRLPRWVLALIGVVAVAGLAVLVTVLVTGDGDNTSTVVIKTDTGEKPATDPTPQTVSELEDKLLEQAQVLVSRQELSALADVTGHAVYWIGERSGFKYEVSYEPDTDDVYVRYLPRNVLSGSRRASFLTIGTYRHDDAYGTVRRASKRRRSKSARIAKGGLAVVSDNVRKSIYIGYPKSKLLIEVFDPSPRVAQALVRAGKVQPIP